MQMHSVHRSELIADTSSGRGVGRAGNKDRGTAWTIHPEFARFPIVDGGGHGGSLHIDICAEIRGLIVSDLARLFALPIALLVSTCLGAVVLIHSILAVTNHAIDTTLRRIFTPGASADTEPIHPLDEFARMLWKSRLTKQQVDRIIAAFPEIKRPLFPAVSANLSIVGRIKADIKKANFVVADLTDERRALQTERLLDKAEAVVDRHPTENRGQDFVIRKALFAAILDRKLHVVGTSLEEMINHAFIPAGIEQALTESVNETLYRVFALPPRGSGGLDRFFRAVPLPVFMYTAVKLITEFVPTAGLRLMRPISRAKIAEGDFSPLSREIIGTALFVTVFVWLTS